MQENGIASLVDEKTITRNRYNRNPRPAQEHKGPIVSGILMLGNAFRGINNLPILSFISRSQYDIKLRLFVSLFASN